jgi:phenylalanyl-tRNA synthetase alpha subunit
MSLEEQIKARKEAMKKKAETKKEPTKKKTIEKSEEKEITIDQINAVKEWMQNIVQDLKTQMDTRMHDLENKTGSTINTLNDHKNDEITYLQEFNKKHEDQFLHVNAQIAQIQQIQANNLSLKDVNKDLIKIAFDDIYQSNYNRYVKCGASGKLANLEILKKYFES